MTEQEFLTQCVEFAYHMAGEGISFHSQEDGTIIDPEEFLFAFLGSKNSRSVIPSYIPDYIARDWIDNGS